MPLLAITLQNELQKIIDMDYSQFRGEFPESETEAAMLWTEVFDNYFANILAPGEPISTAAREAGKAVLQGVWTTVFMNKVDTSPVVTIFHTGLLPYLAAVTGVMTGVDKINNWLPPTSPTPSFDSIFEDAKDKEDSAATIAMEIAKEAHNWMNTGTFVLKATPFTVVPWKTANP